jgi:ABC-type uncharacterized transport system ATPase subunit
MDDIAKLADRLLLISKGTLVYDGTVGGFVAKAELIQTVTYKLVNEPEHREEVKKTDLNQFLRNLTQRGQIENIKIEETDFEDVIHSFLQKESRFL